MLKNNIKVTQNFLTRSSVINKIILKTSINKKDNLIEIGPGKGHITQQLIKRCNSVTAIELDTKLYNKLQIKFNGNKSVCLKNINILNYNLPKSKDYKVFSNIPFNITTKIVNKLLFDSNPPNEAWLFMEKGAAKRFVGKPYETASSLKIKPFFDCKIMYYIDKNEFHRMPSVDVVVVHFKKKPIPDIPAGQIGAYHRFLKQCEFGRTPRLNKIFTKKQLSKSFRTAGIHENTDAVILYVQWLCLFRCYHLFNS